MQGTHLHQRSPFAGREDEERGRERTVCDEMCFVSCPNVEERHASGMWSYALSLSALFDGKRKSERRRKRTSSVVSTPQARFMQNPFSCQKGHSLKRSTCGRETGEREREGRSVGVEWMGDGFLCHRRAAAQAQNACF
jgi:hypothetical protein